MKLMRRDIPGVRLRSKALALTLLALITTGAPVSHAAPVCNVTIAIPGDGNIPATSSITNNSYQACFPDAIAEINNYGAITNNPNATLATVGVFNNKAGASLSNGGTLYNYGVLNNQGSLQFVANGRLSNFGSINNLAGGNFSSRGNLLNNAGAEIVNSGTVNIYSVLTNNGLLRNNSGGIWESSGFFEFLINAGGSMINSGTFRSTTTNVYGALLNNSGATMEVGVSMYVGDGATVTNDGLITGSNISIVSGGVLNGSGTTTLTSGANLAVNGRLTQGAVNFSGSVLSGNDVIEAPVTLYGGELNPGSTVWGSAGKLTIEGDLNLQGGTVVIDISGTGTGEFDTLDISGDITLASGGITFRFGNGFTSEVGDTWTFLTGDTTGLSLDGLILNFSNAPGYTFAVNVLTNGLQLSTLSYTAPVPVPATAWLLGSGVCGLIGVARRKRKVS